MSVGISRPTVFPNPARNHVFTLTSGRTRVDGSRGVSRVTAGRATNAGAATGSSDERGDARTRASMGSNVHASHRSRDAALSPQSRRACSRNDPASPVPVAFVCKSGGFRDRRRRPSTLDPATSHAPRSHVVSEIREITGDRQRAGIRGGLEGPKGASDAFSGTTEVAAVAAWRRESFSDARRESMLCLETGNGALSSGIDICHERDGGTGVVGTVQGVCDWSSREEAHSGAFVVMVNRAGRCGAKTKLRSRRNCQEGRDTRKICTTGPAVRMKRRYSTGAHRSECMSCTGLRGCAEPLVLRMVRRGGGDAGASFAILKGIKKYGYIDNNDKIHSTFSGIERNSLS